MTIARDLLRQAPAATAIVAGGLRCTYGDLVAGIRAAAVRLRPLVEAAGTPPSTPACSALLAPTPVCVGVVAAAGRGFVEAFFAAGEAGAAAAVLQPTWTDRELLHALEATAPLLVVAPPRSAARLRALTGTPVVTVPAPGGLARALDAARLDAAGLGAAQGAAGHGQPADVELRPFYVGFTSGTTGRPRGFVRSHRSWLGSIAVSGPVLGVAAGEALVVPGPLGHSLFLYATVHGLSRGAAVHLQPRFAPRDAVRTLAALPASRLVAVPAMLAALLRAAGDARLPGVRAVISSGAAWPPGLARRAAEVFCRAELVDVYGASELSFVSYNRPSPDDPPGLAGRPFPSVQVEVRDAAGAEAGPGRTGRLWVRSPLLFDGYLDEPGDGPARDAGGWVTVGDRAALDAGGRLHLAGREGEMLVCGGLNVHPEEIEQVVGRCPGVAEVAVVGVDDPEMGQLPCALVRLDGPGVAGAGRRLRTHARAHLARGKRPRRWLLVDDFPRTPSGKVARAALTEALRDGSIVARELA